MATRTGDQVLQALSEVLGDLFSSTTTSAGASDGTSLIDTKLRAYGDNRLAGRYIRLASTGRVVRRALRNTQSSGTLTLAEPFAAQVGASVVYQMHTYNPVDKFLAIEKARLDSDVMETVFVNVMDATITADGMSTIFDIPSTVTQGPHLVYIEEPMSSYAAQWNLLSNPMGDTLTKWTATSLTASVVTESALDMLVPKYDQSCMKFTVATATNGTHAQTVANMVSGMTAALAAGRKLTFAMWVFCLTASRVSLKLTDDSTTTTGTAHQGKGWELLFVEKDVSSTNATTLTATLDVSNAAGAVAGFWNRSWLYFGGKERVVDSIYSETRSFKPRTDASERHIILPVTPRRGYQLLLQGKAPLTALGTDLDTQATLTMELDIQTQEVIAAKAAELMLEAGSLHSDDVGTIEKRIATIRAKQAGINKTWRSQAPRPYLRNPFDA